MTRFKEVAVGDCCWEEEIGIMKWFQVCGHPAKVGHLSPHNCESQLVVGGHGITYILIIMILSADKSISKRREAEEEGPLTDTYNEESS